ncbi:PPC domain-containing protein [Metabacillus sp. B2-18]|uniref:PPC domain-containing protein n=1 Tax=Metabacillus sp. B2-18 TaxID=2897333 RepID=UPI001E52375E|nr:PPC domain-containing protein [Metabacillus sp. B2-18]UGB30553.1 PPC domain-containing protein [Metabacillus sp. B2-18]
MKKHLTSLVLSVLTFGILTIAVPADTIAAEVNSTFIDVEPNQTFSAATTIELNKEYESTFKGDRVSEEDDYYKFELKESGLVTLNVDSSDVKGDVAVLLTNGKVDNRFIKYSSNPGEIGDEQANVGFPAGTYYLVLSAGRAPSEINYSFSVDFEPGEYFEKEDNQLRVEANDLELNKRYKGFFNSNDSIDTYKFTLIEDSTVTLKHKREPESFGWLKIDDRNGENVFKDFQRSNTPFEDRDIVYNVELKAGTYFLEVDEIMQTDLPSFPYEIELSVKSKSEVPWIGRVLIQNEDIVLYNPQGKAHRKLLKGEGLRVFEVQEDRYQVGGGYYVLKGNKGDTLYYYGHVWGKESAMNVYTPDGTLFKKFNPKQTVRVYAVENGRYMVGGGYYVLPTQHVQLDR